MVKQLKYVLDDSTIFWAIGNGSGVIAKHAEDCGKEVGIVVPFEDSNFGEVQFCDLVPSKVHVRWHSTNYLRFLLCYNVFLVVLKYYVFICFPVDCEPCTKRMAIF